MASDGQTSHSNIRFRLPIEGAVGVHLAKQNGGSAAAHVRSDLEIPVTQSESMTDVGGMKR